MEKNKKIRIKSVKECIEDYSKYKKDDYLTKLIISLKLNEIYIAISTEVENVVSEDDANAKIKNNYSIFPAIVASEGNKFWFSCFSDVEEIPESFKENHAIVPVMFKDLVEECLKHRDIEGISINHKSNARASFPKWVLRAIKHHL